MKDKELTNDEKLLAVKFCNELLANGRNKTQAYREVTKNGSEYTVTEDSASTLGSALFGNVWVKEYYNRIVDEAIALEIVKPARIIKRLDDIAEKAYASGDYFATIRASDSLQRALWGTSGRGVKSIISNPDGTMKISFDEDDETDKPADK